MIRVRAPISISQGAVWTHLIFIGTRTARNDWDRGDAQGESEDGWFEDPLWADNRHAPPCIVEALGKCGSRNSLAVLTLQVSEECKGGDADGAIGVSVAISARVLRHC